MMVALFVSTGYFSSAVLNIDGTQTSNYLFSMTSAEKASAKSGINVLANQFFYIDEDIDMDPGAQIYVSPDALSPSPGSGNGGMLYIMSRIYCSSGTWQGVKVDGMIGAPHHLVLPDNTVFNDFAAYRGVLNPIHGYVELWSGTKIEKAEHGIWSLNGGIVQSWIVPAQTMAKFIDCREGIYIEDCQQNPSAIRINRCELTWTSPSIWGESDYTNQFKHITVDNSQDAYFGGCNLSGENITVTGGRHYDPKKRGIGFVMFGSGSSATFGEAGDAFFSDPDYCEPIVRYRMQPSTPEQASISILSFGLVASGDELGVNHTNFTHNMVAIGDDGAAYSFNTAFVDLHDNYFYNSDWMLQQQFLPTAAFKGLVTITAKDATIYDNDFIEDHGITYPGGPPTFSYPFTSSGLLYIFPSSGATDFKVYRNKFNGSEASNGSSSVQSPVGLGGYNLSGLEWKCNEFKNLEKGVSYHGSSGPSVNPLNGKNANNNYINCTIFDIENNTSVLLNYIHPTTVNALNVRFNPNGEGFDCSIDCSTVTTKNKVDNTSQTASVNELADEAMFSFYPNPAQDQLTFIYDAQDGTAEMTIYSMQGQEVIRMNVESGHSYNVSELTNGFYNVSISIDGVKQYRTLVISK